MRIDESIHIPELWLVLAHAARGLHFKRAGWQMRAGCNATGWWVAIQTMRGLVLAECCPTMRIGFEIAIEQAARLTTGGDA